MNDDVEIWKPLYDEGREISTLGRIRTRRNGRGWLKEPKILPCQVFKTGYRYVNIGGKKRRVCRLVCEVFLGKSNLQVNHKNGIKSDDRISNLEYCTPSENIRHGYRTGLFKKGEKHHSAKLTDAEVKAIISDKRMPKEIAETYGISRRHVHRLKTFKVRCAGSRLSEPK